jgi:hypothetical protein
MTGILKNKLYIILQILLIITAFPAFSTSLYAQDFNYDTYTIILNKYIHLDKTIKDFTLNVTDYENLFKEHEDPNSDYSKLLKQLTGFDPGIISKREDQIAFWINVYNIGAIKIILDHYPADSIRSSKINWLTNPWNKKIINVNGEMYALGQIEHEILLGKYRELRAHFAVVCASLSCPEIAKEEYRGDKLDQQLTRQAKKFFSYPKKGISIDRSKNIVYVSRIFKFDSKNFGKGKEDIISFILPFIESENDREYLKNSEYELEFLNYNWELNTLKDAK